MTQAGRLAKVLPRPTTWAPTLKEVQMSAAASPTSPEAAYDLPHSERLDRMIADARLLLSYAVRSTVKLEDGFIADLSDVLYQLEQLLKDGPPSATRQAEQRFLVLYDRLSATAAPVTAQSIRHSVLAKERWLLGPTVVPAILALVVFAIVVLAQSYWVVGKRFRDQIQRQDQKKYELIAKNFAIEDELWHVDQRKVQPPLDCGEPEEPVKPSPTQSRAILEKAKKCTLETSLDVERMRLQLTQRPVKRDLQDVIDQIAPVMTVVAGWYTLSAWTGGAAWDVPFTAEIEKATQMADARKKAFKESLPRGTGTMAPSSGTLSFAIRRLIESTEKRIEIESDNKVQAAEQRRSRVLIHRTDILLDIVQNYVVPSLLGLLGALIFLLRDTSLRVKNYSYVPDSSARGVGRVVVGMMAGVLGGWFIPNVDSVAKSVPPLVIPFVLGYSVEHLFALLDKAVGFFSSATHTVSA